MEKKDGKPPKRRFEDDEEVCREAQKLALSYMPAFRELPEIIEKQRKVDSDFTELKERVDHKLDKLITSFDSLSLNFAIMSERSETQANHFKRLESEVRNVWTKIYELEKSHHETQIKVATNRVSQDANKENNVSYKDFLPYLAMLIGVFGALYSILGNQ